MRGRRVGENHLMLVLGVLEEVVDTCFLHQTADEIEVGLAILNTVFEIGIALQPQFVFSKSVLGENFLDDVGNALLRKNLAVRDACKHPEPGPEDETISVIGVLDADPFGFDEGAVEIALGSVVSFDRDAAVCANCLVEINALLLLAQCFDTELEQLAQSFTAVKTVKYKSVLDRRIE